jgi:hypothetical protein
LEILELLSLLAEWVAVVLVAQTVGAQLRLETVGTLNSTHLQALDIEVVHLDKVHQMVAAAVGLLGMLEVLE